MKKILAVCFLALFAVTAFATDYVYRLPEKNLVVGVQEDKVTFTVVKGGDHTITVHGGQQYMGCATKYCRTSGVWKATVQAVTLVDAAGGYVADVTLPTTMELLPGTYTLIVNATGEGTGAVLGKGYYNLSVTGG